MYGWCFIKNCCEFNIQFLNNSGVLQWQRDHYQGSSGTPGGNPIGIAVSGDVIATGAASTSTGESALVGWDPDGDQLWRHDRSIGDIDQIIVLSNGNFVAGGIDSGDLFCVDPSDGSQVWEKTDLPGPLGGLSNSHQFMQPNGTELLVMDNDANEFVRIDGTDGSEISRHAFDHNYVFVSPGGLGVFTSHEEINDFDINTFDHHFFGLDADGSLNGTEWHDEDDYDLTTPQFMLPSPAGNLLVSLAGAPQAGAIAEIDSTQIIQESDEAIFLNNIGGFPHLAVDDADNIYAYSRGEQESGELLVKFDGDDLTTVEWQHRVPPKPGDLTLSGSVALHSPSSNASPVITFGR